MFSHVRIQIHDYPTAPAANVKSINSAFSQSVILRLLDATFTAVRCVHVYVRDREIPTSLLSLNSFCICIFLNMRINMLMSLKQL